MTVYRHVRLQSGLTTLIGYITDLPDVRVGAQLTLKGHDLGPDTFWDVRYVSDVTRDDVADCSHSWDIASIWQPGPPKSYPGAGVSGIWSRIPPPDSEEAAA